MEVEAEAKQVVRFSLATRMEKSSVANKANPGAVQESQEDLDSRFVGKDAEQTTEAMEKVAENAEGVEEDTSDSSDGSQSSDNETRGVSEDASEKASAKDAGSIDWLISKQSYVKRATTAKSGIQLFGNLEDEEDEDDCEGAKLEKDPGSVDVSMSSESSSLDPKLANLVNEFWGIKELEEGKDKDGNLQHDLYVNLLVKFQYLILPRPVDRQKVKNTAEIDWIRDTGGGNSDAKMTYSQFVQAILQLVETWSSDSDVDKQAAALTTLLNGVTEKVTVPALEEKTRVEIENDHVEEEVKTQRCFLVNAKIKHNKFFAGVAKKKFKRAKANAKRTAKKQQALSRPLTLQYISKLYQQKFNQDKKNLTNGRQLERFDSFIKGQFVMEYGSKKNAKSQLKRFVSSVQKFSSKNLRVRLFAKLAGLDISPKLTGSKSFEQYDPQLCSSHFLPFLDSLSGNKGSFGFILANSDNQLKVTISSFKSKLRATCKSLPANSRVLSSFKEALESGEYSISASRDKVARSNESIESAKFREKKEAQVVNLDVALLAAYDVWRTDKKWRTVFSQVCVAKAAKKWQQSTFQDRRVSKTLHALATVPLAKRRVDFLSYQGIVRLFLGELLF